VIGIFSPLFVERRAGTLRLMVPKYLLPSQQKISVRQLCAARTPRGFICVITACKR
jgi:hypothetical protein